MMTRTELLKRCPPWVLPEPGERVMCAVSGGMDSMCLLHMLIEWSWERGEQVAAAHFNHGLRGEAADQDERFVREVCERWGVPLTVGRGEVRDLARREGLSIEEAARKARYAFLRQAAETEGCAVICTAHHANDNAETILLNLVRGTGLRGLAGMERRRDGICRPLLDATQAELEIYAFEWNIPYVTDETNEDPAAASRNFLRLQVAPLLRELNPKAMENINRAAKQIQIVNRSLEESAAARTAHVEVQEGRVTLSMDALSEAPEAVRPTMLLRLFDLLGVGRKDIGAVHLNAILDLPRRTAWGKEGRISLPHGVTARYCRRWLILETRPQVLTEVQLMFGKPLRWGDYTLTLLDHREGEGIALRGEAPDENRVVSVGPCPPGERLTLPGARGSRSIKRLCLDHRISLEERDRLPAIYAGGRLAAVWRLGADTAFAPEDGMPLRYIKITKHIKEEERDAQ